MTPNDAQIDILLRRYAGRAEGSPATEHLDADEMNAFAEGRLPAAARSRYVSHLADCHDCRQLASQLAVTAGPAASAASVTAIETKTDSWREKLAAFFKPPTLRYAAFAVVLVAAVATVFVVVRRPRDSSLVAQNESRSTAPNSAANHSEESALKTDQNGQALTKALPSASQSAQNPGADLKKQDVSPSQVSPPKPAEGTIASTADRPITAKEAAKLPAAEPVPAFAPPPPGEAERQAQSREQQESKSVAGLASARKAEAPGDKVKATEQMRAGEFGKDRRSGPNDNSNTRNQQALNQNNVLDATTAGAGNAPAPAGRRARNEEGAAASKSAASADRDDAEKAPEPRSVGGHKFRRQGNVWVDTKYRASMAVESISRDSDTFRALSAGVRSIAEQLSGELIVVSKGKAYRIR